MENLKEIKIKEYKENWSINELDDILDWEYIKSDSFMDKNPAHCLDNLLKICKKEKLGFKSRTGENLLLSNKEMFFIFEALGYKNKFPITFYLNFKSKIRWLLTDHKFIVENEKFTPVHIGFCWIFFVEILKKYQRFIFFDYDFPGIEIESSEFNTHKISFQAPMLTIVNLVREIYHYNSH